MRDPEIANANATNKNVVIVETATEFVPAPSVSIGAIVNPAGVTTSKR